MQLCQRLALALMIVAGLAGCANQSFYTSDKLRRDGGSPRILLMPSDVELFERTLAGDLELNAQWTKDGTANLTASARQILGERKMNFHEFVPPPDDSPEFDRLTQLQKMHGTVGETIRIHHADMDNRLPTKNGKFAWSLGSAAAELGSHAKADYALFVWVRDSYSTPGRLVLKITATLMGFSVEGGVQTGHASLVDLTTGEVVWYNTLRPRENGDLRTPLFAHETASILLADLPK